MRSENLFPEIVSYVQESANYLPIIDIKKVDNFIFSVGFEGRVCKWDARKLEAPIIIQDLYCINEQQNLTQLEAMPLGFEICPGNGDLIYVNTIEGSVYELLLTPNSL